MRDRYLEVTFRKGRPLAAYLYLPREPGEKSARTEQAGPGLVVDFAEDGRPIGLEITAPQAVTPEQVNEVLESLGVDGLGPDELAPLAAA